MLEHFNFLFPKSGTVALLGPSGCGKTTLLRLVAGLESPDSGEIVLPRDCKISMVFQEDRLLESVDVRGNLLAVLGKNEQALADACLARCDLLDVAAEKPAALSGGMRRRVAIARGIAFGGDILLLDEPFKGLDEAMKRQVMDFVFEASDSRLTLIVTHDTGEAEEAAQKILRFSGPPLQLLED